MSNPRLIQAIRQLGKAIVVYKPLPAPSLFHQSVAKYRFISGGNRSGKSESNIGYDLVTYALGIHKHRTTPPNATIWACADTWPLVGELLWQEKIKGYLPPNQIAHPIIWHNKQDSTPKKISLTNGNVIEFKSFDQGRKAFEGRAIDAIYPDEQCGHDAHAIWTEMQARLEKPDSFLAWSMTPIRPQAWLEEKFNNPPDNYEVFYANLNDNRISRGGYVADSVIDALIAEWPEEVQETRIKGRFASFMGAVYKTFSKQTHVIPRFNIPTSWERYRGIDFGFNNPFVCLWMARDGDNRWYVYDEHYRAQTTLAIHASRIKAISAASSYIATHADHDAQDRAELWEYGVQTTPAKKAVRNGIEAVQRALKIQANGKPRLYIFDNCVNLIRELAAYHYPEGTDLRDPNDDPAKKDDHTVDALRYIIYSTELDAPMILFSDKQEPLKISEDAIPGGALAVSDMESMQEVGKEILSIEDMERDTEIKGLWE